MPKHTQGHTTTSRKKEHLEITLTRDVGFRSKTTGFEEWEFVHNALPELDLPEVDTSVQFLGRRLSFPLMVSCMTGGYADALAINRKLASACAASRIALGVGSQRQALEDTRYHRTFSIVREIAPDIPIVGNIGAAEVGRMTGASEAKRLVDLIQADAFAIHLNPVQEFLQPEGNPRFRGILSGIGMLVKELPVPVIVKEIGAGISAGVARRLLDAGVRYIDIAGAGGTSWAGVETLRRKDREYAAQFWDWGIPTCDSLRDVAALRSSSTPFTLIASGGIRNGIDAAKCIALGADLAASARPMLDALHRGGERGLLRLIDEWRRTMQGVMFLTGSASVAALRHAPIARRNGR
jgi:isopentenyl-diphosphate delta-isomerase